MKKILLLLALISTVHAEGQTVGFGWDAPTDLTRVTHYRVFATQGAASNLVAEVPVGTLKAYFNLACASDYTLSVLSADALNGEVSAPSPSVPLAMRTAPGVVFNPIAQVWQSAGRWNVTVSWGAVAKPFYTTNYLVQLTPPAGTPVLLNTTNTSILFSNLSLGNYTVGVRGDNWCGQGLMSLQSFTLRGLGAPTNPRIIP